VNKRAKDASLRMKERLCHPERETVFQCHPEAKPKDLDSCYLLIGDWQAQLCRVGERIATITDRPEYTWEFYVLQGKDINAFALPGGKIAFWEGIMPMAQDDSGVAVIMAHEVALPPASAVMKRRAVTVI